MEFLSGGSNVFRNSHVDGALASLKLSQQTVVLFLHGLDQTRHNPYNSEIIFQQEQRFNLKVFSRSVEHAPRKMFRFPFCSFGFSLIVDLNKWRGVV